MTESSLTPDVRNGIDFKIADLSRLRVIVLQDLNNRPADWLHKAAQKMVDLINQDWGAWAKA